LSAAALAAIIYGLTPDDHWNERFNRDANRIHRTGWAVIFAVVISLLLGATVLMSTIAFSGQRYFEYQVEEGRKISQ
jgi:biotin transporter BioY